MHGESYRHWPEEKVVDSNVWRKFDLQRTEVGVGHLCREFLDPCALPNHARNTMYKCPVPLCREKCNGCRYVDLVLVVFTTEDEVGCWTEVW